LSFTEEEIAFMDSQPLARIATVDADGQPDVVPIGFDFDGTYINIGGYQPATTRRHHNVLAGNTKVALVIDDLVSTQPWTPRYLRVYGTAEVAGGAQPYLRITPEISWSWNLGGQPFSHGGAPTPPRRTVHH
jgi:pyridoxamine 5'-phosphate oxidase family protein